MYRQIVILLSSLILHPALAKAETIQIELDNYSIIRVEEPGIDFIYTVEIAGEPVKFDLPHTSFSTAIPGVTGMVDITATPRGSQSEYSIPLIQVAQVSSSEIDEFKKAWGLAKAYGSGDSPTLYRELILLANGKHATNRSDTIINLASLFLSFRLINDAEKVAEQLLNEPHATRMEKMHAHLAISRVHLERNQQRERISSLERAKKLLDVSEYPSESKWLALTTSETCDALIFLGETEDARTCFEVAFELAEPWPSAYARVLNNMGGYTAELLNDLEESSRLFLEADKLYATTGDQFGRALALYNRGVVYRMQGDYYQSLSSHFSALDQVKHVHNPALEGSIVAAIGGMYVLLENYLHAEQFIESALARLKAGVADRSIIAIRSTLGDALRNLDNPSRALELHSEYIAFHESEIKTRSKWRLGLGHVDIALDHLALGNLQEAQASIQTALDYLQDEEESYIGTALLTQTRILLARNQNQLALDTIARSRSILENETHTLPEQIQAISLQLAASYRLGEWRNAELYGLQAIALARSLVAEMPASETQFYYRSTLGSIYANLADVYIQQYVEDQDNKHLWRALEILAEGQANIRQALTIAQTNNDLEGKLAKALNDGNLERAATIRLELDKARFESDGMTQVPSVDSESISISNNEVLIDYAFSEFSSHRISASLNKIEVARLRDQKEINADITIFLEDVSDKAFNYELAKTLGQELIGPIKRLHPNANELSIKPIGTINHLPIAALDITTTTNYRPLIADYALTLNTGGRAEGVSDLTDADILLVTTEDDYERELLTSSVNVRSWGENLASLPWATEEVRTVSEIFGDDRTTLLSGESATLGNLMSSLNTGILHFATHGYISPSDPDLVGLVLTDKETSQRRFLGWRTFTNLPLTPQLVYLNGCQTARGQILSGEGVLGLVQAFMHNGTETVIATRWNISDKAAYDLSKNFYRNLLQGHRPAIALQKAQFSLQKDPRFRNPYYWASHALYSSRN